MRSTEITRSIFLKVLIASGLVLVVLITGQAVNIAFWLNPERIHDLLGEAGWLAPLVYMCLMALAVVIAIIPSLPLNVAAGAFFGPLPGTLYSALGATIGAAAAFLIARYLGRAVVERFIQGHMNVCSQCSDRLLTKIIFISRLIPFISFDVVSYGAGLTKMTLRAFLLASFFGMLPLTFIYNQFGAGLVLNQTLAVSLGILMVVLFFVVPGIMERYNLFPSQHFRHAKEKASGGEKNRKL
jgi:uncharacterized membrane protein YdjX (TVP38/TMEM64 family)